MISNHERQYRQPTASAETLTNADRQRLLEEWNNTQTHFPEEICIHQMFEAQVEQTPDAIAVRFENQSLTYQQLNQRANQVAHSLHTSGIKPGCLVGVYLDRSLEMIAGLLGILKAGAAYVPLDPAYPLERLSFILADTQVPVILTQAPLVESLPPHTAKVICLDSDSPTLAAQSQENPIVAVNPNHLMYVIYTSGSTGQPKGVMIPHRGICNQLHWRQTTFCLTATDRVLQTISFSFDPSVWQIFWPLSCGAQLVLPRPGRHQDSADLVQVMAQQQITVMALVPSLLRVLLAEKQLDRCRCLRYIFCGGEALPLDLQERFFARFNLENVLHNVYGPTEASIDATFWPCQRGTLYPIAPIGRPIANTQIYILDSQLQPVPIGASGELHIGGAGLADGYLNRPELTAEKFIPHPHSDQPGARLYKTGDLARYLPDGNIEFLGRIDHQVKIRGFRIELGEIEAVLNQHPAVKQSVTIAREDIPGDRRLVAYIVPQHQAAGLASGLAPGLAPGLGEIRSFLKERLPEYMVPAAFVMLETLPLTPNGKVDRHNLPAPAPARPELENSFVAPEDPIELELTQIWELSLGIQPIGIQDNFFELGGNSLLAARLLAQTEEKFQKKLPLATLLQAPTIEQLANILRQAGWTAVWDALVPIQPNGSKPAFYCVHDVGGNVLSYYPLAHYLGGDQPFYGLQSRGLDGESMPHDRIEDIAADYIKAIQAVQPDGPYFLGGYSFGGLVAYEMAHQLHIQGQQVAVLALLDTPHPEGWYKPYPLPLHLRFCKHMRHLSQLNLREKFTYIQEKLGFRLFRNQPSQTATADAIKTAHKQAGRKYQPQLYPGRAILWRAAEYPQTWSSWLPLVKTDPQLGWGQLFAQGLEIQDVPGHHFNMLHEPHVQVLANRLRAVLESEG